MNSVSHLSLVDRVRTALESVQQTILAWLPNLLLSFAVVLIGFALAFMVRKVVKRLLTGFFQLLPKSSDSSKKSWQRVRPPFADWISTIVFWMVVVFFLSVATEIMGLRIISTWLGSLTSYMPRVLAGVLIGFSGLLLAGFARELVSKAAQSAGFTYGEALGKISYFSIVLVTAIMAVNQVGIRTQFLTVTVVVLVSTSLAGAALSFGLGAQVIVRNILSAYYVHKQYSVGQRVQIGEVDGKIISITPTAVILKTSRGQMMIPAKHFMEEHSLAIHSESNNDPIPSRT